MSANAQVLWRGSTKAVMHFLDFIPLWGIFVFVILIGLLCIETGRLQGARVRGREERGSDAPTAAMVAAVLSLLAFMLAITFGIAGDRFNERRLLLLDEVNAIGTAYLRAEFLDPSDCAEVRKLFREYVSMRVQASRATKSLEDIKAESTVIQDRIWQKASHLAREHPTPISALFVSAVNEVIDLHTSRLTASIYSRVPDVVWSGLLIISALSMCGVGYFCGLSGTRAWAETLILIVTFATVLMLVADLDRPREGLLKVNQRPLFDLAQQLGVETK